MEKKWLIIIVIIAIFGFVTLGLFLNNYLDPINTAIREENVDVLISYASSGTSEQKIAAIEGFKDIQSLKTLQTTENKSNELVFSSKQAQVVDALILIILNDPDMDNKRAAIETLSVVWNDKAVTFLKSIEQNPDQIFLPNGNDELKNSQKNYLKSYAGFSLASIEGENGTAQK